MTALSCRRPTDRDAALAVRIVDVGRDRQIARIENTNSENSHCTLDFLHNVLVPSQLLFTSDKSLPIVLLRSNS